VSQCVTTKPQNFNNDQASNPVCKPLPSPGRTGYNPRGYVTPTDSALEDSLGLRD